MDVREITRQHDSTEVHEVRGRRCTEFIAVQNRDDMALGPLYIELDGTWHRFFLDAGLLFWREGSAPEPEDDLLEHDCYLDLAEALRVSGASIARIEMHDCRLTIQFDGGATLGLYQAVQQDEGATIVKMVPAGS